MYFSNFLFLFFPEFILTTWVLYIVIRGLFMENWFYVGSVTSWIGKLTVFVIFLCILWLFKWSDVYLNDIFTFDYFLISLPYNYMSSTIIFFLLLICIFVFLNESSSSSLNSISMSFELIVFYCISTIGILLFSVSTNLLVAYVFLEIQSLSTTLLISCCNVQDNSFFGPIESSLKFYITSALNSSILLLGILFIYSATGTIDMNEFGLLFNLYFLNFLDDSWVVIGLVLLICGLLYKLSIFPFHNWVVDVVEGSLSSVSLYILTVPNIAVFTFFTYFLIFMCYSGIFYWHIVLTLCGFFSILVGSVASITQLVWTSVVAYLSVASSGYVSIGISFGTLCAVNMVFLYLLIIFTCFIIFFCYYNMFVHNNEIDSLRVLYACNPWVAIGLCVMVLSIAGVPFFGGFFSKFFLFESWILMNSYYIIVFALLINILTIFLSLRVCYLLFFCLCKADCNFYPVSNLELLYIISVIFNVFIFICIEILLVITDIIFVSIF